MFKTILRAISLLKDSKKTVIGLSIANFFFAILILVEPIFFKQVIDILVSFSDSSEGQYSMLYKTLVFWVVVGLLTIFLRLYVTIITDVLAHKQFGKNAFAFYRKTMDLSMRFHMDSSSAQLVKKITKGTDGLFRVHLDIMRRIMPSTLTILFLIPVVLYFNVKLGLFVIISGFISGICSYFLASITFSKQNEIEDIYSNMSSLYGDTFSNMSIVKSFNLYKLKDMQLEAFNNERLSKQIPILKWWGLIITASHILKIIVSIGIIFFSSYLYINGEISIGEIVMFLSFSLIFLSSIEEMTWSLEGMFWVLAGIKDHFKILDTEIEVKDAKGAKILENVKGSVKFQDVDFSYDGKRTVLSGINMDIKAGEKIAFVGHTGSGKTTMTNLLLRFFDRLKGDIQIDDQSIYSITQNSLRENIGVVFQDNPLFNASIRENIILDNDEVSDARMDEIIKKSHASEFVARLNDGLDTIVGEKGVKLSGGEKQRLAIARAFLKDAPILVLDEATSALDAETEKYLQGSFDELMKGRTTFIIAHRLSTIMKADRIFVFDAGRIVEEGSYKELVAKKGKFAKLVAAQRDGFVE